MTARQDPLGPRGTALRGARHLVFNMQHDGSHEQNRTDARQWMDAHGGGRCPCDRCVRDQAKFDERQP